MKIGRRKIDIALEDKQDSEATTMQAYIII